MKFAENIHKSLSAWMLSIATGLIAAEVYLPQLQQSLPPNWYRYVIPAILIARIIKQQASNEEPKS